MRKQLVVWIVGAMVAVGGTAALVGCAADTTSSHPPISSLKEGVNLLDAKDPAWGANTAFVSGGRVVYVETRVGPLKPEVYRQEWPEDPPNEMDMRFVDKNGYTFFVMRGGDRLVDPTWAEEMSKTQAANRLVPKAERDLDWKLAQQGAAAVAAALPAAFQHHTYHLAAYAQMLPPAENPVMQAKEARMRATPRPKTDAAYGTFNYGAYSWLETDKYSGGTACLFGNTGCTARHSATIMWDAESTNESTYTWVLAISANNHGRAYNGSYMSHDCYSNGGWFYNATISGSTASGATGAYDGQGGCQTAYSWSGSNNQHLCNDDAAFELWQAKDGSMNTRFGGNLNFNWSSSQGASGWGSAFSGVSAFACNYPSGDYNTPNCP